LENLEGEGDGAEGADGEEGPADGSALIIIQAIGEQEGDASAEGSAGGGDQAELGNGDHFLCHGQTSFLRRLSDSLISLSTNVDEGWGAGGGLDVKIDVAAGLAGLEDVEGHVDDVVEMALGLIAEADLDGAGASAFGVEADAGEGKILGDVLWAGLSIEDFDGDWAADVVAAELIEIFEPLVFGDGLCLHERPPFFLTRSGGSAGAGGFSGGGASNPSAFGASGFASGGGARGGGAVRGRGVGLAGEGAMRGSAVGLAAESGANGAGAAGRWMTARMALAAAIGEGGTVAGFA